MPFPPHHDLGSLGLTKLGPEFRKHFTDTVSSCDVFPRYFRLSGDLRHFYFDVKDFLHRLMQLRQSFFSEANENTKKRHASEVDGHLHDDRPRLLLGRRRLLLPADGVSGGRPLPAGAGEAVPQRRGRGGRGEGKHTPGAIKHHHEAKTFRFPTLHNYFYPYACNCRHRSNKF